MTRHGTLWTTQDIANHFGVSKFWVYRKIKLGVFVPVLSDGPVKWFCPDEVELSALSPHDLGERMRLLDKQMEVGLTPDEREGLEHFEAKWRKVHLSGGGTCA